MFLEHVHVYARCHLSRSPDKEIRCRQLVGLIRSQTPIHSQRAARTASASGITGSPSMETKNDIRMNEDATSCPVRTYLPKSQSRMVQVRDIDSDLCREHATPKVVRLHLRMRVL